jgi:cell division transport system permease protein
VAVRVDYVLRETGSNLRRNFSLTFASLITVVVSLSLVGAALLIRNGVENATAQWKGGVEFIVYMNPDATQEQIDLVGRNLTDNPDVAKATYFTKQQAFDEFQEIYRDSQEFRDVVTSPDILPTSWRVVPNTADPDVIASIGTQFKGQPGVYQVSFQQDAVKALFNASNWLRNGVLVMAAVLLFAAGMLILNTIRTAIFARRREIEVMKLVGATNWFIRIPFMLEGLVQGLLGSAAACGVTWGLNRLLEANVGEGESLALLQDFHVATGEVRSTGLLLLVVGAVVGSLGSGIAVTRFLDV